MAVILQELISAALEVTSSLESGILLCRSAVTLHAHHGSCQPHRGPVQLHCIIAFIYQHILCSHKCAATGNSITGLDVVAQVNSQLAFLCVQIHAQVVVYLCILDNDQRSQMNLSVLL